MNFYKWIQKAQVLCQSQLISHCQVKYDNVFFNWYYLFIAQLLYSLLLKVLKHVHYTYQTLLKLEQTLFPLGFETISIK